MLCVIISFAPIPMKGFPNKGNSIILLNRARPSNATEAANFLLLHRPAIGNMNIINSITKNTVFLPRTKGMLIAIFSENMNAKLASTNRIFL